MPVTTAVNNKTVVHKDSGGITAVFPDVCKTPSPGGPVPVPYPNVARSSDSGQCARSVKVDGQPVCIEKSVFTTSTGDEAGAAKGVVSSTTKGKAEFVMWSMDVKIEGKKVPRALDLMLHNDKNTPPAPLVQAPKVAPPTQAKVICMVCEKELKK